MPINPSLVSPFGEAALVWKPYAARHRAQGDRSLAIRGPHDMPPNVGAKSYDFRGNRRGFGSSYPACDDGRSGLSHVSEPAIGTASEPKEHPVDSRYAFETEPEEI